MARVAKPSVIVQEPTTRPNPPRHSPPFHSARGDVTAASGTRRTGGRRRTVKDEFTADFAVKSSFTALHQSEQPPARSPRAAEIAFSSQARSRSPLRRLARLLWWRIPARMLAGLRKTARLAGLTRLTKATGLAGLRKTARLAGLTRLTKPTGLPGLSES